MHPDRRRRLPPAPAVSGEALQALTAHHRETVAIAEHADERTLREQYHPLLSPLGWHVGHCSFIETLWVQGELLGRGDQVQRWQPLYQPEMAYKPARGVQLPERDALIAWCRRRHDENMSVLADPPEGLADHPLLRDGYLAHFLLQHYAQHLETMDYILAQRSRQQDSPAAEAGTPIAGAADTMTLPAGRYAVGSAAMSAYDNEREPHWVALPAVRLAGAPVSSAEYQAFIDDGGYRRAALWDADGWAWRRAAEVECPSLWYCGADGRFRRLTPAGWAICDARAPVVGVSHFEASAFARWAGGRLPHEHEWEAARNEGMLGGVGQVWEWCSNAFHAYPGFRPFPYDGYSLPWFDGKHFVMRGASRSTRAAVRRASFRNFYTRDVRHVFAGLRLAFDV